MSRLLIETLNELSLYVQNSRFQSIETIDNENDLYYVSALLKSLSITARRELYQGRYALNPNTAELLKLCGFMVTLDEKYNIIIRIPRGRISITNPLQMCTDINYHGETVTMCGEYVE